MQEVAAPFRVLEVHMLGLFGPERLQYASGGPVTYTPVYIMKVGTHVPAVLYGDASGSTTISNPVWTDQYGELTFFADLGVYDFYLEHNVYLGQFTLSEPVPGGGGVGYYEHTQVTPQSIVTINHGLGRKPPDVGLYSLDFSEQYEGFLVRHIDDNTLQLDMDSPQACRAIMVA